MKKNLLLILLFAFILNACTDIDFTLPPGPAGASAYEEWVSMVELGVYPEWKDYTSKEDFMKFLTGKNGVNGKDGKDGKSAYDIWVDMITPGNTDDPHNPGQKWPSTKKTEKDFFEYLTGAKGDPGTPGSKVIIGTNDNWFIDGEDTGIPARGKNGQNGTNGKDGLNGLDGKSAYEIWSELVQKNKMPDRMNPSQTWDKNKFSLADFWAYFSGSNGKDGTDGKDGKTPYIGDNGNWWIDAEDTGVPAKGKDGKNGIDGSTPEITIGDNGNWFINNKDTGKPSKGSNGSNGNPGASAYEIWKVEVAKGLTNPHPDDKVYGGTKWPKDKIALDDFWFYLRGKDGKDGDDGETIIKGKPNVIVMPFDAASGEAINPQDGGAVFQVYDKEGEKVGAGVKVKRLPGLNASLSYTTNNDGIISVPVGDLPDKLDIAQRSGFTAEITINGVTEQSANNTIVPNKIHTRIIAENVFIREVLAWPYGQIHYGFDPFVGVRYKLEKQVDGEWVEQELYVDKNELTCYEVNDVTKPLEFSNLTKVADYGKRKITGSGPYSTTLVDYFYIARPIVLTAEEKSFTGESLVVQTSWKFLQTLKPYEWNGQKQYYTIVGENFFYGEKPIMNAAVRSPELYPAPSINNFQYHIKAGTSYLTATVNRSTFNRFYHSFTKTGYVWEANSSEGSELNPKSFLTIAINKSKGGAGGSSVVRIQSIEASKTLNFQLFDSYPGNLISNVVYMYDQEGINSTGSKDPDILGDLFTPYRATIQYVFIQEGDKYYIRNAYSDKKIEIPLTKE